LLSTVLALSAQAPASGLTTLDVVVIDRGGKPVTDLQPNEITVRENGRNVVIDSFKAVTPDAPSAPGAGRAIVLLLDDLGMPSGYTAKVQQTATLLLEKAAPTDAVAVMRLGARENLSIDRTESLRRIKEYASKGDQSSGKETALRVAAEVSQRLMNAGMRRKLLVWLGEPGVIDVEELDERGRNDFPYIWQNWQQAMAITAQANVSVYAIDPIGRGGRSVPDGFLLRTGGDLFSAGEVSASIDRVMAESANYYLLSYKAPENNRKELRTIDVRTSRSGLQIRARKNR
jgi:VWFA-related protein